MKHQYTLVVSGLPKGQPRPRAFARKIGNVYTARMYDAGTAESWKQQVAAAWREAGATKIESGPIALTIILTMPRPKCHFRKQRGSDEPVLRSDCPFWVTTKPDLDNLEKAVMDALTVIGAWSDDSQVAVKSGRKRYGMLPGAVIDVYRMDETD